MRSYNYWTLVRDSGVITQQFSSISVFVAAFIQLYTARMSIWALLGSASAATAVGYAFWDMRQGVMQGEEGRLRESQASMEQAGQPQLLHHRPKRMRERR